MTTEHLVFDLYHKSCSKEGQCLKNDCWERSGKNVGVIIWALAWRADIRRTVLNVKWKNDRLVVMSMAYGPKSRWLAVGKDRLSASYHLHEQDR